VTYGNDSLYGAVAKQRFACEAQVTLSSRRNDDDDDGRVMQLTVVLSITAAAAARQLDCSLD